MPHAFQGVDSSRSLYMDVARRALDRIGTWAIGRRCGRLGAGSSVREGLDFLASSILAFSARDREVGIEGRRWVRWIVSSGSRKNHAFSDAGRGR